MKTTPHIAALPPFLCAWRPADFTAAGTPEQRRDALERFYIDRGLPEPLQQVQRLELDACMVVLNSTILST